MNSHVERIRMAADSIMRGPLRQPDLFERSVWIIDEIGTASAKATAQLVNLRVGRARSDIETFEHATSEIIKLLEQAGTLTAVLADQIAQHKAGGEK